MDQNNGVISKRPQVGSGRKTRGGGKKTKTSKRTARADRIRVGRITSASESLANKLAEKYGANEALHFTSGNGVSEGSCQVCDKQEETQSRPSTNSEPAKQSSDTGGSVELTDQRIRILRESISDPIRWCEWLFGHPLDDWQRDAARAFARGEKVARAVCNGGGKSRLFAGLGSWVLAGFADCKIIMTAGVFRQCMVMRDELSKVMHKLNGWSLKEQELVHPRGTRFVWFTADNPGYFEGHHAEYVAVLIDESKSVDDGIYNASVRCTATKKRFTMAASSTGGASGWFYDCFASKRSFWNSKQISALTIPRIPRLDIEEVAREHGVTSSLYKSMVLAEFIDADPNNLIQLEWINRLVTNPPRPTKGIKVAGIDLSASRDGDESVIIVRDGNVITDIIAWRDEDPMRVAGRCILELSQLNVPKTNVFADAGGLGSGIVSRMQELGWPVNGVQFGGKPISRTERVHNRMTEIWDEMANAIEKGQIILARDEKLFSQLTSRKFKVISSGRLVLETKAEMKKRGLSSPDRADALALCLCNPVSHIPINNVYQPVNGYVDRKAEGYISPDGFDLGG